MLVSFLICLSVRFNNNNKYFFKMYNTGLKTFNKTFQINSLPYFNINIRKLRNIKCTLHFVIS